METNENKDEKKLIQKTKDALINAIDENGKSEYAKLIIPFIKSII
mgnify:CR=1 FL=1